MAESQRHPSTKVACEQRALHTKDVGAHPRRGRARQPARPGGWVWAQLPAPCRTWLSHVAGHEARHFDKAAWVSRCFPWVVFQKQVKWQIDVPLSIPDVASTPEVEGGARGGGGEAGTGPRKPRKVPEWLPIRFWSKLGKRQASAAGPAACPLEAMSSHSTSILYLWEPTWVPPHHLPRSVLPQLGCRAAVKACRLTTRSPPWPGGSGAEWGGRLSPSSSPRKRTPAPASQDRFVSQTRGRCLMPGATAGQSPPPPSLHPRRPGPRAPTPASGQGDRGPPTARTARVPGCCSAPLTLAARGPSRCPLRSFLRLTWTWTAPSQPWGWRGCLCVTCPSGECSGCPPGAEGPLQVGADPLMALLPAFAWRGGAGGPGGAAGPRLRPLGHVLPAPPWATKATRLSTRLSLSHRRSRAHQGEESPLWPVIPAAGR